MLGGVWAADENFAHSGIAKGAAAALRTVRLVMGVLFTETSWLITRAVDACNGNINGHKLIQILALSGGAEQHDYKECRLVVAVFNLAYGRAVCEAFALRA